MPMPCEGKERKAGGTHLYAVWIITAAWCCSADLAMATCIAEDEYFWIITRH